jgi:hypothetical protein
VASLESDGNGSLHGMGIIAVSTPKDNVRTSLCKVKANLGYEKKRGGRGAEAQYEEGSTPYTCYAGKFT